MSVARPGGAERDQPFQFGRRKRGVEEETGVEFVSPGDAGGKGKVVDCDLERGPGRRRARQRDFHTAERQVQHLNRLVASVGEQGRGLDPDGRAGKARQLSPAERPGTAEAEDGEDGGDAQGEKGWPGEGRRAGRNARARLS